MGGTMPIAECSRCWLYQPQIHMAMSWRACALVVQRRRSMSSCWRVEKNDSAGALSRALPVRPVERCMQSRRQAAAKARAVYWPDSTGRRNTGLLEVAKPSMRREYRSSTVARNTLPWPVGTSLKSPHHFWFIPEALKSRLSRSEAATASGFWLVRPL